LAAACLLGCLVASPGQAQQNLDAGKNAVQIFNGNCSACHRSAQGLLRKVSPSSLPEFLREHYTTGNDMAQMLSGYLTSNRGRTADPGAAAAKRGTKPQVGVNLRPDAPIGSAATDAKEGGEKDQQNADKKPPRAATAKPEDPGSEPAGKHRGRPDVAAHPPGPAPERDAAPAGGASPKEGVRSTVAKRKRGEPPVTSGQPEVASKPEPASPKGSERSIDAAVPVPEPVVLPPPSVADIKPADVKPEAPAAPEKTLAEKPLDAPKPAPPAEAAAAVPAGPPAPPISQ
jgi:hypothetical protein